MYLPSNPDMLLSVVNTKLRDEFSSLNELCDTLDVDKEKLISDLKTAGYRYKPEINQFG